jgi:hypothetical protein
MYIIRGTFLIDVVLAIFIVSVSFYGTLTAIRYLEGRGEHATVQQTAPKSPQRETALRPADNTPVGRAPASCAAHGPGYMEHWFELNDKTRIHCAVVGLIGQEFLGCRPEMTGGTCGEVKNIQFYRGRYFEPPRQSWAWKSPDGRDAICSWIVEGNQEFQRCSFFIQNGKEYEFRGRCDYRHPPNPDPSPDCG